MKVWPARQVLEVYRNDLTDESLREDVRLEGRPSNQSSACCLTLSGCFSCRSASPHDPVCCTSACTCTHTHTICVCTAGSAIKIPGTHVAILMLCVFSPPLCTLPSFSSKLTHTRMDTHSHAHTQSLIEITHAYSTLSERGKECFCADVFHKEATVFFVDKNKFLFYLFRYHVCACC